MQSAFQRVQKKKGPIRNFLTTHTPVLFSRLVTMWNNTNWDKWVKWEADPLSNVVVPPWKNIP